jgi:hypothetical protein
VNCRFCGSVLPLGALFCGECGRTVASSPAASRPVLPEIVFSAVSDSAVSDSSGLAAAPQARPSGPVDSEYSCPQCAAPIDDDDVFCGECGFVLSSSYLSAPSDALGDPRQTTAIHPVVAAADESESESESAAGPEPEPEAEAEPEPERNPEQLADAPPKILRTVPDPFPWGKSSREPLIDLEATRAVGGSRAEERFVLQFSTGESVTVSGAGLVGRNPVSQPGEFVDQLVTVFDAGKSVSKTHLEFGQEGGRFWVSDRYSTNGSTVRQPDAEPKRCEPGRRYFIARGTRVDIGEQFFVVS